MRNFKYLQIEHYSWNTHTDILGYNIYPVDYILSTAPGASSSSSIPVLKGVIGGASRFTAGLYSRQFYRNSDTSLYIESAYQLGPGASGTGVNYVSAIPARIIGLK